MSSTQLDGSSSEHLGRSPSNSMMDEAMSKLDSTPKLTDSTSFDTVVGPSSLHVHRMTSPIQSLSKELDNVREHQRVMDVESARLLSRARSNTATRLHLDQKPLFEKDEENYEGHIVLEGPEDDQNKIDSDIHLHTLAKDDEKISSELPLYPQPSWHEHVNFSSMEEFAKKERTKLGVSLPTNSLGLGEFRRRFKQKQRPTILNVSTSGDTDIEDHVAHSGQGGQQNPIQRHSKFKIRSGKMAAFESTPIPILSLPSVTFNQNTPKEDPLPEGSDTDKLIRFSFYSGSFSLPIHARHIYELPADGQSYEQLFCGRNTCTPSGTTTQLENINGLTAESYKSHRSHNHLAVTTSSDDDIDAWWLDVLNPTDEEMQMFAKVNVINILALSLLNATSQLDIFNSPAHN
jgi:hypothetical protein